MNLCLLKYYKIVLMEEITRFSTFISGLSSKLALNPS